MSVCVQRLHHRPWNSLQRIYYPRAAQTTCIRTFHICNYRLQDFDANTAPKRYHALRARKTELYPRFKSTESEISCSEFLRGYGVWVGSEGKESGDVHIVHGRVDRIRSAGSRLIFIDVIGDNAKVQGVCNLRTFDGVNKDEFKDHFSRLQRGDIIRLTGNFCKTTSGEPSLRLQTLPELLSPCLHPLPTELNDPEIIVSKRHVGFLTNHRAASFIRAKSMIIQGIRQFLLDDDHLEVQTPILAEAAGGAVARPFRTKATEFMGRELALRIAPELWLKRMVIGGFDRIFEIGPSFRNEGIDLKHNPEFSTCEFYRSYTDLKGLMNLTEQMFSKVYQSMSNFHSPASEPPGRNRFSPPYEKIDFITGIEQAIGAELPDLSSSTALDDLTALISKLSLPVQVTKSMNLPQILDKLCGEFLEPLCKDPTFITGHPECMSPLSKSYSHPTRSLQRIAPRAELFVDGQEIANMYEEENSPFEQRRKFLEQLSYKSDDVGEIDEAYLEALEWGMPPVGGWGCGIERLTMAMTGAPRISDVLSFGTLRNVVSKHQRK